MEHLQIFETPSTFPQDTQSSVTQGTDGVWHRLPSSVNWRLPVRSVLVASAVIVILLVIMQGNGSDPDQQAAARQGRIVSLILAIEAMPNEPTLYWMLGDAYFEQQDYNLALANYRQYLEHALDNPPQRQLQRLDYLEFHAQTRLP